VHTDTGGGETGGLWTPVRRDPVGLPLGGCRARRTRGACRPAHPPVAGAGGRRTHRRAPPVRRPLRDRPAARRGPPRLPRLGGPGDPGAGRREGMTGGMTPVDLGTASTDTEEYRLDMAGAPM